jgi:hypothetical protein
MVNKLHCYAFLYRQHDDFDFIYGSIYGSNSNLMILIFFYVSI